MTSKFNRNQKRPSVKPDTSPLKDDSLMPFGKYQGFTMEKVPDYYLLLLYTKYKEEAAQGKEIRGDSHRVMLYIEDFGPENLKP